MSSSDKDKNGPPTIETQRFGRWRFLFKAYLDQKRCAEGLSRRPAIDEEKLSRLLRRDGSETLDSEAYREVVRKKLKCWKGKDRQAYGYLVKACELDPSAMEVVLREELEDASARTVMACLEERFNQGGVIGVVQAKLAAFFTLEIGPNERAEIFVNRLLEATRELHELGQEYVDKDIFCLGRLKESLVKDTRFQALAISMRGTPNLTFDEAVKQVTAFESSLQVAGAEKREILEAVLTRQTTDVVKKT